MDALTVAVSNSHGKRNWKAPRQAKVRVLTEQDIADGKHSIFDVVIPLPGFEVDYPEGRVAEIIDEVMKADGLDPVKMRREQRYVSRPMPQAADAAGNTRCQDRTARSSAFHLTSAGATSATPTPTSTSFSLTKTRFWMPILRLFRILKANSGLCRWA